MADEEADVGKFVKRDEMVVELKDHSNLKREASDLLIPLHKNPPLRLSDRRNKVLVACDTEEDKALFVRLSPEERRQRAIAIFCRIRANDEEFLVAKFFHANLGVEGSRQLCDALKLNTYLRVLYLTGNNLGVEGCRTLCNALVLHPTIVKLDIQCNKFGVEGGKCIGYILLLASTTLHELDISGNDIGDCGCQAICNALMFNQKSRLTVLRMGNNKIKAAGFHLAKLIRQNRVLRMLYLWHNRLGTPSSSRSNSGVSNVSSSFVHIADALPASRWLALIDLTYNNITTRDCKKLVENLSKSDCYVNLEPRLLKIVEGNLLTADIVSTLSQFFCLFRVPFMDPMDCEANNIDPVESDVDENDQEEETCNLPTAQYHTF